jgi:hypothetical protein
MKYETVVFRLIIAGAILMVWLLMDNQHVIFEIIRMLDAGRR